MRRLLPLVLFLVSALPYALAGRQHSPAGRTAGLRSEPVADGTRHVRELHELADHRLHPRKILLHSGVIDTTQAEGDEADAVPVVTGRGLRAGRAGAGLQRAHKTYIVQLEPPITAEVQRAVQAAAGVRLGPYLPHNAYLVAATSDHVARLRAAPHVVWVGRLKREHKAHPSLSGAAAKAYTTWTAHVAAEWAAEQGVPSAQRLAGAWRRQLAGALRGNFSIDALEGGRVRIELRNAHDGPVALDFLAGQPAVHWVEPRRPLALKNVYAGRLIQADASGSESQLADLVLKPNALPTPLYDRGITGAGEVLGLMDDGLDYDHCYFADSPGVSPISNPLASSSWAQPEHRKVIASRFNLQYGNPIASMVHGTHTAATAVGSPCSGCVPANPGSATTHASALAHRGIAYDAQLSFISMTGKSGELLSYEWDTVFAVHYQDGARVHSNSWGCAPSKERPFECNVYDQDAVRVDTYAWNYPDALLVFAAGNDGLTPRPASGAKGVVSSPATSKNGVSAGATLSTTAGFLSATETVDGWTPLDQLLGVKYCKAYPELCDRAALLADPTDIGSNNLAAFSSYGPTADARIKPELVAPGFFVISANSDNNPSSFSCGLRAELGTSMSAPVVAGAAALVRQYFREGWWPSGTKRAEDGIPRPMASLLRAVLVSGARAITGTSTTQIGHPGSTCTSANSCSRFAVGPPQFPTPNEHQGWGSTRLDTVLYFADSPFQLAFCDGYFAQTGGAALRVNLTVTGTLRATLAWTDPPGKANAAVALVNNLDMLLQPLNTSTKADPVYPNRLSGPDSVNNVEHIEWKVPAGSTALVLITVTPSRIEPTWGPQAYTLLLHGSWGTLNGCYRSVSVPPPAPGPSNPHATEPIPAVPDLSTGLVLMANVTVALPLADFNAGYSGQFRRALGRALKVNGDRIIVDATYNGSTIVALYIRPNDFGNVAAEATSAQAYAALAAANTNLDLGPGLRVTALSPFRVQRPLQPIAVAVDPGGVASVGGGGGGTSVGTTPAKGGGDDSSTKIVAGAVAGSCALVIALAVIAVLLMRRSISQKRAIIARMEEAHLKRVQAREVRVSLDAAAGTLVRAEELAPRLPPPLPAPGPYPPASPPQPAPSSSPYPHASPPQPPTPVTGPAFVPRSEPLPPRGPHAEAPYGRPPAPAGALGPRGTAQADSSEDWSEEGGAEYGLPRAASGVDGDDNVFDRYPDPVALPVPLRYHASFMIPPDSRARDATPTGPSVYM